MKDEVYCYKRRIESLLNSIGNACIDENSRKKILEFYRECIVRGYSKARIIKYLDTLKNIYKLLGRPFSEARKEDIIELVRKIEERNYSDWTKRDYKLILRVFFKWLRNTDFGDYLPKERPQKEEVEKPKVILPQLSDDAWALLFDINAHPFRGLTGRYRALNLSGRRASSAKDELLEKGLASEVSVALGSYRPVKFLVLTSTAINALRNMGHDVRLWHHTGHMGFKHQLYTVLIAYTFKNNYPTFVEKTLGDGRRVDVLTILDGKRVVIEVETGIGIDIEKKLGLLDEVDELIIVTDEQTDIRQVQEATKSLPPGKVQVYSIIDYLRYLKANYSSRPYENKYNNPDETDSDPDSSYKAGKKRK